VATSGKGLLITFGQTLTTPVARGFIIARVKLNEWTGPYLDLYRDQGETFNGARDFDVDPGLIGGAGYLLNPGRDILVQWGNFGLDVAPVSADIAVVTKTTLAGTVVTPPVAQSISALAWAGEVFDSCWTPSSPFMRSREGQPILDGRLTIMSVRPILKNTGGIRLMVHEKDQLCWDRELFVNGSPE
jgi:hypothetical protein